MNRSMITRFADSFMEPHEFVFHADSDGPLRDALRQLEKVLQEFMQQRVESWRRDEA